MGNARSASYSYHQPLEQQEEDRHRSLPSPLQHQSQHQYQQYGQPRRAVSSRRRHQSCYWSNAASAGLDRSGTITDRPSRNAPSAAIGCSDIGSHRRSGEAMASDDTMSVFGGCSAENSEPTPLPFVRHRNLPIRLPRINLNKESWSHQSFNNTLNKCGRHKSLSCSMMHGRTLPTKDSCPSAAFVDAARLHVGVCATLRNSEAMRSKTPTPLPTPPAQASVLCRVTGRMTITLQAIKKAVYEAPDGWKVGQDSTVGNMAFRRQFLSMRSYHSQKRPLLLARSSSVRTRSSYSVPILTELEGQFSENTYKAKHYLEMARMKKQSVEQSLSTAYNVANLLHQPLIAPPMTAIMTEDSVHHTTNIGQQLEQQQSATRSGLHKSWTSISQESLGDAEDEDGGYTTTLTVGDNGSLHSRFSDSSYLTMLTANTSLSSGYHGPASLTGDGHPASSSCSDEEDDNDEIYQHRQRHQMMMSNCDGTTSGMFYLEWLRQVTGSVPAYVELRQGRLHLKLIQDDVMEHIDGAVKVSEITELLRAEYGIVTGGRSREGRPIITFPDRCNFATLTEDNYRKLIVYLTSVPALHDADLGYVLIVDRRSDRWNAVKATLLRLSNFFPGLIAVVYVLRPSGLLQKAISEVSNKFFREDFRFKVVVCSCLDELHQRIDSSQLTIELGGCLFYDHQEWIDTRVSVESFSANTADISAALRKFSRRLQDTELPNDVQSTQAVLQHQGQEYASLKMELNNANAQGETLLNLIKKPAPLSTPGRRSEPWLGQLVNITTVERLLIQMDETQRTLDEFWNKHAFHLRLCLQLRQFELDFRELQVVLNEDIQVVSDFESDGDSVSAIDALLQQTYDCRTRCQLDLDRADALYSHAGKLMTDYADSPVVLDSVRPKSIELQRVSQALRDLFIQRLDSLERSRDLYNRIEKANRWCSQGVDLLASQQLEKCSSPEFAAHALADIEEFLTSASEFRDPKQFRNMFQDIITPETKSLINQVIQRLQDVQVMCDRRTVGLRQIVSRARVVRPVQTVPPEPSSLVRSGSHSSVQGRKEPLASEVDSSSPPVSANIKVRHVLTELLETERVYVNEISIVLKGYRDQLMDPDPSQSGPYQVPVQLVDKTDVLFGNLPEICAFHGQILLPDLESSLSSPQLVASCFLRHTEDLHSLYSFYCQNIPQSEELRRQVGENNPFLRQCQTSLGHKLPLSAYLLKPVQRITKYQLLLRDLMKYSQSPLDSSDDVQHEDNDLQSALDAMLAVVRCVNDSMHQVAITGYQGSLAELGRLLLQGGFSMWAEGKRDRLRELRLKPMQRHVFLYERGVVLCKRVGKEMDKATYQFKHLLKMSEVGLTETVHSGKGSDARKFELWLQGRHEVWVLQAPARDVKETWITEIKRVLLNQFHQLKGQTIAQTSSSRTGPTLSSIGASGVVAPAGGVQKMIQISSSIPNGAPHPSSPYGPKSLRPASSCSSWEYNNSTAGSSSSSSGVSSTGDRSSIVDTSASSTISRASSGSRMLRSATVDEDDGWSTDFSLSDEDMGENYLDHVEDATQSLRRRYVVLADYAPLGPTEAGLREGDIVDLVRVGCAGWWYVRPSSVGNTSSQEGWAPSAYLETAPAPVIKSPCSSGTPSPSVSSQDSEHDHLQ
ncbi:putative Guanine nucleotide exchange factor DBS [Daphnia magna]|uniref:Putative Guanine nucleotide exchange factor DBS n=1 Tax=Daphnia magna TaxID=35525 RepID=A0A162CP14_9CRUS|nr:putative Guanine nucleotide exchange factor DBS [Daphnia magna]